VDELVFEAPDDCRTAIFNSPRPHRERGVEESTTGPDMDMNWYGYAVCGWRQARCFVNIRQRERRIDRAAPAVVGEIPFTGS